MTNLEKIKQEKCPPPLLRTPARALYFHPQRHGSNAVDVILSLFLTLNVIHNFFQYFYLWLSTGKCLLGGFISHLLLFLEVVTCNKWFRNLHLPVKVFEMWWWLDRLVVR